MLQVITECDSWRGMQNTRLLVTQHFTVRDNPVLLSGLSYLLLMQVWQNESSFSLRSWYFPACLLSATSLEFSQCFPKLAGFKKNHLPPAHPPTGFSSGD